MKLPAPRRAAAVALLLAGSTAVSSCAAFSDDASSDDGRLNVVASFYPLQYVTQRVAGNLVTVGSLTQPGQEPHDLTLSPKETGDVTVADLVVYERGLQASVDDAVGQKTSGDTLDAAEVAGLEPMSHHGHDDEEHAGDEGEDHDHGDLDPHFWQDPLKLAALGDAVADKLSEIDPDHAEEYAANAADLRADLEKLDHEYSTGLASCERDTIVVSHDAFGYLSRYGLYLEPIAGLSPDAEPTPADLGRLQELVREEGITTVFSERLVSPRLAETLAEEAGVTTGVLDPIEGLSDETADEDYRSLAVQNLEALKKANGCS